MPLAVCAQTESADTVRHWGFDLSVNPCIVPKTDDEIRAIVKKNRAWSAAAQLRYHSLPTDSNAFDAYYNYPTLGLGISYNHYQNVSLHRDADYDFGRASEVDYTSHLGNTVALYGFFERPFRRQQRWELGYSLKFGLGYAWRKYDKYDNVDNEMIGSHLLIYVGANLHATYHFAPDWGLRAGIDFSHHSNGSLRHPNKGSNTIGPFVGILYQPEYTPTQSTREAFARYNYINISVGAGGKSLYENWMQTQFNTPPDDPDYRMSDFPIYTAYSGSVSFMRRWALAWATGGGIDLYYGSYSGHVKRRDETRGYDISHSPWSVGIAVRQEAIYRRLTAAVSVGVYAYRQMGHMARRVEKPFYETIGLRYTTPLFTGLQLGFNVKAHAAKADLTEAVLVLPVRLK